MSKDEKKGSAPMVSSKDLWVLFVGVGVIALVFGSSLADEPPSKNLSRIRLMVPPVGAQIDLGGCDGEVGNTPGSLIRNERGTLPSAEKGITTKKYGHDVVGLTILTAPKREFIVNAKDLLAGGVRQGAYMIEVESQGDDERTKPKTLGQRLSGVRLTIGTRQEKRGLFKGRAELNDAGEFTRVRGELDFSAGTGNSCGHFIFNRKMFSSENLTLFQRDFNRLDERVAREKARAKNRPTAVATAVQPIESPRPTAVTAVDKNKRVISLPDGNVGAIFENLRGTIASVIASPGRAIDSVRAFLSGYWQYGLSFYVLYRLAPSIRRRFKRN